MEPPLCVVSNWVIRVYILLVWSIISGSSNLDICCYHCLILTLIFNLKVLINFFLFFFFFFIIIIIIIIIIVIVIVIVIVIYILFILFISLICSKTQYIGWKPVTRSFRSFSGITTPRTEYYYYYCCCCCCYLIIYNLYN